MGNVTNVKYVSRVGHVLLFRQHKFKLSINKTTTKETDMSYYKNLHYNKKWGVTKNVPVCLSCWLKLGLCHGDTMVITQISS